MRFARVWVGGEDVAIRLRVGKGLDWLGSGLFWRGAMCGGGAPRAAHPTGMRKVVGRLVVGRLVGVGDRGRHTTMYNKKPTLEAEANLHKNAVRKRKVRAAFLVLFCRDNVDWRFWLGRVRSFGLLCGFPVAAIGFAQAGKGIKGACAAIGGLPLSRFFVCAFLR